MIMGTSLSCLKKIQQSCDVRICFLVLCLISLRYCCEHSFQRTVKHFIVIVPHCAIESARADEHVFFGNTFLKDIF